MSTYLIGTDEAGYGPNLGPLVISVSVWELFPGDGDDNSGKHDLYERLAGAIASNRSRKKDGPIAIADSKKLYKPKGGLGHLEQAVLTAWKLLERPVDGVADFFDAADPRSREDRQSLPWAADYSHGLPLDLNEKELDRSESLLRSTLEQTRTRLVDLRSRIVYPRRFNQLVDRYDSKGLALSRLTLGLIAEAISQCDDGPIDVVCDKHGGRNRYADLLSDFFPEEFIEVYEESRERSLYRFGPSTRRASFLFQAKGESFLPAALASMMSKYLRELAMRAFNAYWSREMPGLRPTAGYPQDARRFREETAERWAGLGIDEETIWRKR